MALVPLCLWLSIICGVVVLFSTETKVYCILIPVSWEWDGPGSTFAHGASPAPRTLKLIYER